MLLVVNPCCCLEIIKTIGVVNRKIDVFKFIISKYVQCLFSIQIVLYIAMP